MENELILDDVYDVWFTSFWQTPIGYAILFLLVALGLLLLYGIITIVQRRRATTKERSLRALQLLAAKVKKGNMETKKVYQELTSTLKLYSQWRYELPQGMTDYELMTVLESADCPKAQQHAMVRIITDAQTVKFGQVAALKSQIHDDIKTVICFVEETATSKQRQI